MNEESPIIGRSDRVWGNFSPLIPDDMELCIFTPNEVSEVLGFELRPARVLAKKDTLGRPSG